MCGISGIIRKDGVSLREVVAMTDIVTHRGPDGVGYWLWDGGESYGQYYNESEATRDTIGVAALGHRRLSILDLSDAGRQPMSSPDGEHWIVHNGEIYNYIELRAELTRTGHQFKTGTDTEVILAAYREWGVDCFRRFNGMWAIGIIDLVKRVLILSRDHFGIKPLYTVSSPNLLLFASEIKQFFKTPWVRAVANSHAIAEYIDTGYDFPPATFFRDVTAFPPASFAEVPLSEPNRIQARTFWQPPETVYQGKRSDVIPRIRELFMDAVRIRLRSDVPVGVCLSGGLDSSSIYRSMQSLNGRDSINTFTAKYDDPRFDEVEFVRYLIDVLNGSNHFAQPTPQSFLQSVTSFIHHHDEPPGSLSMFAAWSVMEAAREHNVKVLLNGQGGDELFSGYWPAYYQFLSRRFSTPWIALRHIIGAVMPTGNYQLLKQVGSHFRVYRSRKMRSNREILAGPYRHHGYSLQENWADRFKEVSGREYRLHELTHIHLPRLLKWEDRNSMAFGVEGRYPFLDVPLAEFALSLSEEVNLHAGWNKYAFRKAMQGIIPKEIQWRKTKVGFETPQSEWIRSSLNKHFSEWSRSPSERIEEWVDLAALRSFTDELLGESSISKMDERHVLLMRLYYLDQWLQVFCVEAG